MATIKEMAEEYAATGEFLENGKEMIDFQAEKAYMAGANAVLEELERLIATLRTGARKLFEDKIEELKRQIKELKDKNRTLEMSNKHMENALDGYRLQAVKATQDYQRVCREVLWLRNRKIWARIINKVNYDE